MYVRFEIGDFGGAQLAAANFRSQLLRIRAWRASSAMRGWTSLLAFSLFFTLHEVEDPPPRPSSVVVTFCSEQQRASLDVLDTAFRTEQFQRNPLYLRIVWKSYALILHVSAAPR
jgi:hypothetical protein